MSEGNIYGYFTGFFVADSIQSTSFTSSGKSKLAVQVDSMEINYPLLQKIVQCVGTQKMVKFINKEFKRDFKEFEK